MVAFLNASQAVGFEGFGFSRGKVMTKTTRRVDNGNRMKSSKKILFHSLILFTFLSFKYIVIKNI
jgi:hypothetical protein